MESFFLWINRKIKTQRASPKDWGEAIWGLTKLTPTGRKGIDIMKNIKIIKAKYIVESDRRKGKAVIDLDTGEVFTSAKECADMRNFPYANFAYKLRDGKSAVDGHLYCYVADMAYYADAIQSRICAREQVKYDAMKLQLAEIEHKRTKLLSEMGKFKNIKED